MDFRDDPGIRKLGEGQCWHCGKATHYVDLAFEAYLCSQECYDAKWEEFMEAYNNPRTEEEILGE